jgi:hypothetical protein
MTISKDFLKKIDQFFFSKLKRRSKGGGVVGVVGTTYMVRHC